MIQQFLFLLTGLEQRFLAVLFLSTLSGAFLIWWVSRHRRGVNAFRRGEGAYNIGEYEKAIAHFDYAAKCMPHDPNVYCVRAFARIHLEEYELAMGDAETAFSVFPNYFGAYNARGNVHARLGNTEAAFDDFRKAIKLNPEDSRTFVDRAEFHRTRGNYETAYEDLSEAIEVDPNNAMAHLKLGEVLYYLGKPTEAINHLTIAMELDPNTKVDGYYFRAMSWMGLFDFQKAHEDFTRSLEHCPNDPDTLIERAYCSTIQGNSTLAARDFSAAIRLDPKLGKAWSGRGKLNSSLGNYSAAIADFDQAKELLPEDWGIPVLQGVALIGLKDCSRAKSKLETALSMKLPDQEAEGDYADTLYFR